MNELLTKMFENTSKSKTLESDNELCMRAHNSGIKQIKNGGFWSAMEEELFQWALCPACDLTPRNVLVYTDNHCKTERGPAALEAMIGRMLIEAKEQGINTDIAYQDMRLIQKRVNRLQEAV